MGSAVVTSAKKKTEKKSRGPGEKHDLKTCWMIINILEMKEKIKEKIIRKGRLL